MQRTHLAPGRSFYKFYHIRTVGIFIPSLSTPLRTEAESKTAIEKLDRGSQMARWSDLGDPDFQLCIRPGFPARHASVKSPR